MNLKQFHWVKQDNTLVSEASSLGYKPGQIPGKQLYNDSSDFGITIHSPSGHSENFILNNSQSQFWEYSPINTQCKVKKVIIYND